MKKGLEGLLRSAERLRVNEEKVSVSPPRDLDPVVTDPSKFEVFQSLTRWSRVRPLFHGVVLPLLIGAAAIWMWPKGFVWVLGGWYVLLALCILINRIRYRNYLRWEKRLPFALEGWRELIAQKRMACDLCWTDITIDIDSTNPDAKKYTHAAFEVFCEKSQKAFYPRKMSVDGVDHRSRWSMQTDTRMAGSANPEVLRLLKDLLQKDISLIAKQPFGISRVRIMTASKEFEEPIDVSSSEGTAA